MDRAVHHYCTYFDRHYLLRGLTVYRSLAELREEFELYVLCMDKQTFAVLSRLELPHLRAIDISEVERWKPDLLDAKENRNMVEYYFTLSPHLPLFIFSRYDDISLITYLDADLLFFDSPQPLFDELGDGSILLFEHRFPPHLRKNEAYGRFNVQFLSFRRDDQGLSCLERWSRQCLDWCYDRLEENRFADQKYLDDWPATYDRAVVAKHAGGGIGPWNWSGSLFELRSDRVYVDDTPMIFYHYHAMKILTEHWISLGMARYGRMTGKEARWIYGRYAKELRKNREWLSKKGVSIPFTDKAVLRVGHSLARTWISSALRHQLMYIS